MAVLVGRNAPDFSAAAVLGDGTIVDALQLSQVIKGKYALIFFYPLDFTFVCPSELIALNKRMGEFTKRGVEVLAVSVDSQFTHNAWRNTSVNNGGIGPVSYSLVADVDHSICQSYGVEHPEASIAFRGAFIIDQKGVVRSQIVNDLPLGRNIDELLRLVDALQHHAEFGEVCPAGWMKGDRAMQATSAGVANYLAENADSL